MFVAGCTYVHISGDGNTLDAESQGTKVDTHTDIKDDSKTKVER